MGIYGQKETLEWFQRILGEVQSGSIPRVYLIVDFEVEDYYKIKYHGDNYFYSLFDLLAHYHVNIWGGTYEFSRAFKEFYRTIEICKSKYRSFFSSHDHRIAILEMTNEGLTLLKKVDL